MRRIATAIGPMLALVAVSVPTTPAHSSVPLRTTAGHAPYTRSVADRTASRSGIGLDSTSLGASFVHVSWNWIRAASGYRIQVSRTQDFSSAVRDQRKRNSAHRPAGGREALTVGRLHDATYYWVRVRKVRGTRQSPWSAPVEVATKAHVPDRITYDTGVRGSVPGTTTIRWRSDGGHTDYFKITTALTPFGTKGRPAVGRHSMTFRVPGDQRSLTLTPDQTAAAGAGLGSGHHLFFRITAVRSGEADRATREYAHTNTTGVAGEASTMTGTRLRFASYNVHLATRDAAGHPWSDRAPLVAQNLARSMPDVIGLQELTPGMWTNKDGGPGLATALNRAGMGSYRITRDTTLESGVPGETHILYNPASVQLASSCDPTVLSCVIQIPDNRTTPMYASYAEFRDVASGQQFYFVSAHLATGATNEDLRGRQAQAIADAMDQIDTTNEPVVVVGDFNSSQLSNNMLDESHGVLVQDGYYDTTAAATQVHLNYNSVNAYATQHPSPYGFGSMIDAIMTKGMPGADRFAMSLTGAPYPSDHNLVTADVRLP